MTWDSYKDTGYIIDFISICKAKSQILKLSQFILNGEYVNFSSYWIFLTYINVLKVIL